MQPIIEIRNISKRYQLGEKNAMYGSFREALVNTVRNGWQRLGRESANGHAPSRADTCLWAVRDINLNVYKGDTVGIIGSNGAGKSTLLKVLSRITEPTEGSVSIRGRMASLLEVGTGFHPELTGRENIYLNGAILGMHKHEIEARFDDIIAFAGIGKFLDTPVKRYSSGMYVRLAFSIAAHLDPEILIVDEVLAVGDVAFQKKCLGKMAEAYSRSRTVLFVSHNLAAVESLCNRAVVLHQGRIAFTGTAKQGISYYMRNLSSEAPKESPHLIDLKMARGRSEKYQPHLRRLELYTEGETPLSGDLPAGAFLKAVISFELKDPCTSFDASIAFDTDTGQRVCTAHSAYEPTRAHEERSGEQSFVCQIARLPLVPGEYNLHVGLDIGGHEVDWVENAARLTVLRADYYGTGIIPTRGTTLIDNRWTLQPAGITI